MTSTPRGPYRVSFTPRAARHLRRVDTAYRGRITRRISALADAPRPRGAIKLDQESWRFRVGPWRIFYEIRDAELSVIVTDILRREKDTYSRR